MKFSNILSLIATSSVALADVSLREAAKDFRIGVAANTLKFNNEAYLEAVNQFNYMVAENGCKLSGIQPQKGVFTFDDCDAHLAKAEELGMDFRGHCLIWHSWQPQWFQDITDPEEMEKTIVNHVTTVLNHYKGKIDTWDIVNEAIDDESTGENGTWDMRDTFLYRALPNFVDVAFKTAREVDPSVKLFYNDYDIEGDDIRKGMKTNAVYNFVKDLVDRGIPIDGVGLQYHLHTDKTVQYDNVMKTMRRFNELGLEVQITEMDVNSVEGKTEESFALQAKLYGEGLKACLDSENCTGFLIWGVGDSDSWRKEGYPLAFNSDYTPKPAYYAMLDVLKEYNNIEDEVETEAPSDDKPSEPVKDEPAKDEEVEAVRDLANGFRIGVAANTLRFNDEAYINATKKFNYMVAENGCKLSGIQPQKGVFTFDDCDAHLAKAEELGMDFRGHCLIWHSWQPQWFQDITDPEEMEKTIVNHVTTVLNHYKGKIDTWDIVNEAIDDESTGENGTWDMRDTFLYRALPNFVDVAFKTAREVDPSVKLFYNDYDIEGDDIRKGMKTNAVYNFVKDLVDRGIPIDGVGLQYHLHTDKTVQYDNVMKTMRRFNELGLEVQITEMDVNSVEGKTEESFALQAKLYGEGLKACLDSENCTGFLIWGVGDSDSWRKEGYPLAFNSDYTPKPAYYALVNTLKEYNAEKSEEDVDVVESDNEEAENVDNDNVEEVEDSADEENAVEADVEDAEDSADDEEN